VSVLRRWVRGKQVRPHDVGVAGAGTPQADLAANFVELADREGAGGQHGADLAALRVDQPSRRPGVRAAVADHPAEQVMDEGVGDTVRRGDRDGHAAVVPGVDLLDPPGAVPPADAQHLAAPVEKMAFLRPA
jgi:hypothetical protein